jgi:hypothetical protein
MRHIQSFNAYNESFKSIVAGSALLFSLLSNQVSAQDSKRELKAKAKMSQFDSLGVKGIVDSIMSKNYEIVQKQPFYENKFLVSTGSGITKKDAIDRAKDDFSSKISFLGRTGSESIYIYEQSKTFHAVIIAEILPKKQGMYDPTLGTYR